MMSCWSSACSVVTGWSGLPGGVSAGSGSGGRSGRRGGTRSARVIESRAPATASRTRTHRTLTVQRDAAVAQRRVLGVVGGAHHRGDRALERAEDLGHRDGLGRAGELVAAVRAAGAGHQAGLAQADDELLEVGAREVLLGGDLGQRGRARARRDDRAGPSAGRRTRPSSKRRSRRCRGRPGDGSGGSARGLDGLGRGGQGNVLDIRVISSGLSVGPSPRGVNRRGRGSPGARRRGR